MVEGVVPLTQRTAQAITCPRCGGVPAPDGGPGFLARCRQCGVLGRIECDEAQGRLLAPFRVDDDAARRLAAAALPARLEQATTTQERLLVPFYRIEVLLAGEVCGQRQREERRIERVIDEQGASSYVARAERGAVEPYEQEVQRLQTVFVSGCPLTESGLPLLDRQRQSHGGLALAQAAGDALSLEVFTPHCRADATVLDPLIETRAAELEADHVIEAVKLGLAGMLLPGAEVRVERVHHRTTLLYWPIHRLRFGVGERAATALVDGVSGGLIALQSADRPAASGPLERRIFGLAAIAVGLFAGGIARLGFVPPIWLQAEDQGGSRLRMLLVGLVGAGLAWQGLRAVVRRHLAVRS